MSWGGAVAPIVLAVEDRFKAAILESGGLEFQRALPEADQINFVTRVRIPVLMLNGRYDHFFPVESSQLPLFRLLGTPEKDKKHVIYETGHAVAPQGLHPREPRLAGQVPRAGEAVGDATSRLRRAAGHRHAPWADRGVDWFAMATPGVFQGPGPASVPSSEIRSLFGALEESPDPVFVTDRHDRIVFFNASAQKVLGFAPEEAVGTRCFAAFEGGDRYGNRYCSEHCPITQIANRGEVVQPFDLRLRARDGHHVDVQVTILNLTVPAPELFYLLHIFRSPQTDAMVARPAQTEAEPPSSSILASRSSADARARRLTAREVEVLGMLAAGRTTPEIAERLQISVLTARNHLQNILEKLELHSKAEAVAFAFQKKLIS